MTLYLSHQSALRYWLTKTQDEAVPDGVPDKSLAFATASMKEVKCAGLPFGYSPKDPLHLLVPNRSCARGHKSVVTHVWSRAVPQGSFNELWGSNRISSPEFTYLQMAGRRPLIETVEIGCYLCGGFSIEDEGRGYVGERSPLTDPGDIRSFLDAAKGAYGAVPAMRALEYVIPSAASPMEVLLMLAFSLPPELGGWGFPPISVNQRIEVDERLQTLIDKSYVRGDIYMPSVKGDVEYDSYAFHTGKYRLDHTQARRNVLEAMGVKTVSATWGQTNTFDKFETFIWMVRERFGIEQREFDDREKAAQKDLYALLTDKNKRMFCP